MLNPVVLKDRSPRWLKDVANASTRRYGLATAGVRPGPDFLIIGAKRGGTTSLFNYLLMHPGVLGLFPQPRGRKSTDYFFFRDEERSESWYRSHFHTAAYRALLARRLGYQPVGGEASPFYGWDPRIAGRVHAFKPEVKAIFLLRDPVKRAWSHHQERVANGIEHEGFEAALDLEQSRLAGERERMTDDPSYHSTDYDWFSYRQRGVYLPQIQNWESVFGREQLLVLRSEDMYSDVQGVFNQVCEFLGLPRHRLPTTKPFGAGQGASMPIAAKAALEKFYAPHNRALEAHLGRRLGWSS